VVLQEGQMLIYESAKVGLIHICSIRGWV
jgi:hypothetical protein